MHAEDGTPFRDLIRGMGRMFGQEPDALVLDAYWLALRDWSLADFEAAASLLMRTSRFMPRPADFTALRKAGEVTAGEAWQMVLQGTRLDPATRIARAAAIVGGQYAIRHANIERDLPHIQRRFLEAYEELSAVDPVREALPQIAGPGAALQLTRDSSQRGPIAIGALLPERKP